MFEIKNQFLQDFGKLKRAFKIVFQIEQIIIAVKYKVTRRSCSPNNDNTIYIPMYMRIQILDI